MAGAPTILTLQESRMPETTRRTTIKTTTPAAPMLARASESGDPAVHKLLGDLETARANADDQRVQAIVAELADLGFQAS